MNKYQSRHEQKTKSKIRNVLKFFEISKKLDKSLDILAKKNKRRGNQDDRVRESRVHVSL